MCPGPEFVWSFGFWWEQITKKSHSSPSRPWPSTRNNRDEWSFGFWWEQITKNMRRIELPVDFLQSLDTRLPGRVDKVDANEFCGHKIEINTTLTRLL